MKIQFSDALREKGSPEAGGKSSPHFIGTDRLRARSPSLNGRSCLVGGLMMMFCSVSAAQLSTTVATCDELKPANIQESIELCTSHPGCKMIMRSYDSCAKAKTFFEKLRAAIGDGESGRFSRRKVLSEHVFEAHLSDVAKKLDQEPGVKQELLGGSDEADRKKSREALQKIWGRNVKLGLIEYVRAADDDTLSFNNGEAIYIGNVKDDRTYGYGTMYFSSGTIIRGDFAYMTPRTSGYVDKIYSDGHRRVGYDDYENTGYPRKGMTQYVAELNGDIYVGALDSNEKRSGLGQLKDANGKLKEEGVFANGELYQGVRYDESGAIIAQVDKPAEARKQAEDKRLAAEAAATAAAQRIAEQKAAEAEQFRQTLLASNPGQLFAMADRLAAEGKADQAREARRSLISRFPNHPLAATAAQQIAGVAPSAASGASAPAQRGSAKFSSVCIRDLEKIEDLQRAVDMVNIPASNDLWLIDINEWVADLMQRCASNDSKAASIVSRSRQEAARIRQYCAQPRQDYECTQWGVGANSEGTAETLNNRYHQFFEGEYRKAMSDPNYSADKGTAAGPGMKTETAARSANAASTSCASTPQESFRRFSDEMEQFSLSKPNAPPTSTSGSGARDQNQYALFYGTEGLTILEKYRTCLSPADYQANKTALEGMRDNGRAGCQRLSTSPDSCTATYPAGWPAN